MSGAAGIWFKYRIATALAASLVLHAGVAAGLGIWIASHHGSLASGDPGTPGTDGAGTAVMFAEVQLAEPGEAQPSEPYRELRVSQSSVPATTEEAPVRARKSTIKSNRADSAPKSAQAGTPAGTIGSAERGSGGDGGTEDGQGELRLLAAPLPPYPLAARIAGFEGEVHLRLALAPSGRVQRAELTRSSGRSDCDSLAAETVEERWRFAPLGDAGKVDVVVQFRLDH